MVRRKLVAAIDAIKVPPRTPTELFLDILDPEMKIGMQTEYRFAKEFTGRQWRTDFAWPDRMLLLEIEGGIELRGRRQGRHTRPAGYTEDCIKYSWASLLGYRLIRVTRNMIIQGEAYRLLKVAFSNMIVRHL